MQGKNIAALKALVISFILGVGTISAEAWAQIPSSGVLSIQELASRLQTPEDIAHYLWRHFRFETDRTQFGADEYWQLPEELLANGKGDCEDFALFAQALLKEKGIASFVLSIYGNRYAHTVCIFKENGKFNVIDGTKVIRLNSDDLRHVMTHLYPFWKKGVIVTPHKKSKKGRILSTFEKMVRTQQVLATSA